MHQVEEKAILWLPNTREEYQAPTITIAELAETMQTLLTLKTGELAKNQISSSGNTR
jgi:hypothetical protein